MTSTIDSAGRITLPLALREKLGLRSGDQVSLEERDGALYVLPAAAETGLAWSGGVLVHKGQSDTAPEDVLAELRGERLGSVARGVVK